MSPAMNKTAGTPYAPPHTFLDGMKILKGIDQSKSPFKFAIELNPPE